MGNHNFTIPIAVSIRLTFNTARVPNPCPMQSEEVAGSEAVEIGLFYEAYPSMLFLRIELQVDVIANEWERRAAAAGFI